MTTTTCATRPRARAHACLPAYGCCPSSTRSCAPTTHRAGPGFVTAEHYDLLWSRANGLVLAPLLVDGRLTGHWRIPGSGVRRPCEVTWFAGTRQPRRSELDEAVAAVESAYGVTVTDLSLTRG